MTSEKAIELLHRLQDEQFDGEYGDERREALEMAVRVLSGDGDTIYRQQAIDAMKEHRALYCDNTPDTFSKLSYAEKSRVDELDTAIATLVNLPSAQPERKKGKWIDGKGNVKIVGYGAYCSCCKRESEYVTNYCPNCGARMDGETK